MSLPKKLTTLYPRTLANLQAAIRDLPHVWVFDNDALRTPFRHVAVFEQGRAISMHKPVPKWLRQILRARDPAVFRAEGKRKKDLAYAAL